MGCKASSQADSQVKPLSTTSGDDEDENDDDDFEELEAIGFNSKANQRFAVEQHTQQNLRQTACLNESNNLEDTDEFRVLRVSALSGQVTLYVAGGKHKKPVQYGSDRVCPHCSEQPKHCSKCPFCTGNELNCPPNVLSFGQDGTQYAAGEKCEDWKLRVFPNIFPMLICPLLQAASATAEPIGYYGKAHDEALKRLPHSAVARGVHANTKVSKDKEDPTCVQVDAKGVSEVFVENTQHNALLALEEQADIELLLHALSIRCNALSKESWVKQLLIFKQYGPLSGGSLVHPHTQVVSLPVLPPQLVSRLEFATHIYQKHGRCATCLACVEPFIKDGEASVVVERANEAGAAGDEAADAPPSPPPRASTPSSSARTRLVHITEHFVVSVPYASSSQYSMTVAPRRHSPTFTDITDEEKKDLAFILALLSQAIYYGLDDPSYNCFIRAGPNVDNVQLGVTQVSRAELNNICHWILELRPRFPADLGGFEIASGIRVVSGLPEDHAAELRNWVQDRLKANVVPVKSETVKRKSVAKRVSVKKSQEIHGTESEGGPVKLVSVGGRISSVPESSPAGN